ncbi:hypothetical protein [Demequina aurantiaca]|uniref:hypothetical protein n=1 Tax=Demequina aurantiaca TaxID=676200 RepID=UPI000AEBA172|nr:hypothetical protein [Demequina aurantiaca]
MQTVIGVTVINEVVTTSEHVANEMAIPPAAIGLLAFAGLMALLFITFAFRSVGTRH